MIQMPARLRTTLLVALLTLPAAAAAEQPNVQLLPASFSSAQASTESKVSLALNPEIRRIMDAPLPALPITTPSPSRTTLLIWMISALLMGLFAWLLWRTEGRA